MSGTISSVTPDWFAQLSCGPPLPDYPNWCPKSDLVPLDNCANWARNSLPGSLVVRTTHGVTHRWDMSSLCCAINMYGCIFLPHVTHGHRHCHTWSYTNTHTSTQAHTHGDTHGHRHKMWPRSGPREWDAFRLRNNPFLYPQSLVIQVSQLPSSQSWRHVTFQYRLCFQRPNSSCAMLWQCHASLSKTSDVPLDNTITVCVDDTVLMSYFQWKVRRCLVCDAQVSCEWTFNVIVSIAESLTKLWIILWSLPTALSLTETSLFLIFLTANKTSNLSCVSLFILASDELTVMGSSPRLRSSLFRDNFDVIRIYLPFQNWLIIHDLPVSNETIRRILIWLSAESTVGKGSTRSKKSKFETGSFLFEGTFSYFG